MECNYILYYLYMCDTMDGADQAKYMCPRNVDMVKVFEKAWRPRLHLVCVLISGVIECYYILDEDMYGDSNMEMTIIMRSLEKANEVLRERGVPTPAHLVMMADNTSKEMRNQWSYKLNIALLLRNLQRSSSVVHNMVGHTHGLPDQRFSIMIPPLNNSKVLEHPEDQSLQHANLYK